MREIELHNGDCLEVMDKLIEDGVRVDAIIADPPYGTTACKWDSIIPFDSMWMRLKNLRKEYSAIVLFGSEPFSSALRMSNIEEYKYDWVWSKNKCSNFINAKYQPMKNYENIVVFGSMATTYSVKGNMKYNPQGVVELVSSKIQNRKGNKNPEIYHSSPNIKTIQKFTNYPKSILDFPIESKTTHPTQKPVKLMEYLIKTYTNEGDTILDFTMGSGTTGVACKNTNRNFIGIELDESYFNIAKERIGD